MEHILSGISEALLVVDSNERIRISGQQMTPDGALACHDASFEAEMQCADGGIMPLLVSCSVFARDHSGNRQYVVTGHDLRKRKRVEEERLRLEQQLKQAERLSRKHYLAEQPGHAASPGSY